MLQPKQIPYPIQGRTLRNQGPNSLYATRTYRTRSGNEPASIGGREGGNRFSQQAIHMIISGHNSGNMDRLAWRGLGRGRKHAHTHTHKLPPSQCNLSLISDICVGTLRHCKQPVMCLACTIASSNLITKQTYAVWKIK